jgi:hypothetical protein
MASNIMHSKDLDSLKMQRKGDTQGPVVPTQILAPEQLADEPLAGMPDQERSSQLMK